MQQTFNHSILTLLFAALAGRFLCLPLFTTRFAVGMAAGVVLELCVGAAANRISVAHLDLRKVGIFASCHAALVGPIGGFVQVDFGEVRIVVLGLVFRLGAMLASGFLWLAAVGGCLWGFLSLKQERSAMSVVVGAER